MSKSVQPKDIIIQIQKEKIEVVDLRFTDFLGIWQHFSIPAQNLSEDDFKDGFGIDGSSMRGWAQIHESDMLASPVADTAFLDPYSQVKTLNIICTISDPITGERYTRDPRNVAEKAENYLKTIGLGDTAYFGPEAEFFIFEDIRYDQNEHEGYYHIDSVEGEWNTGKSEGPNLGYKIRHKEGYFPVPPTDKHQDLRNEMMLTLQDVGIDVECQHHEVASGGQAEIDFKFGKLLNTADDLVKYKYIVRNTANKHGKTVTFMPKPMWNDNGSGMHVHLSIWKGDKNLFAGDKYAGCQTLHYMQLVEY